MSKKVIVAVSGGPDSMALLDMMRKEGYICIVAHVNYGVRETAARDQQVVEDYCNKYNLTLEVHHAEKVVAGNFQAIAREIRYKFFTKLSAKYSTKDVYVAHHQGDLLETYIMQKKRNITPEFYGIKKKINYKSIYLIRPLLSYSKEELIDYCENNKITYGIDESNLEDNYKRNKIRHHIVDKLSQDEVKDLLIEIHKRNIELAKEQEQTKANYNIFIKDYRTEYLLSLSTDETINVLRCLLSQKKIFNLSKLEYLNIIDYLRSESNREFVINNDYSMFNEYNKLVIASNLDVKYSYTFNEIEFKKFEHFEIKSSGSRFEAVTISENDFPITIRNFQKGDKIEMKYGSKRISRWFIDNKIGQSQRRSWPIVLNKDNQVILVPKIGCNLTHFSNNPNMFVVK